MRTLRPARMAAFHKEALASLVVFIAVRRGKEGRAWAGTSGSSGTLRIGGTASSKRQSAV